MNTNQGALYFGAGIDLNQWRRDIDSMRRDIAGLNQNVARETRNMDSAFKNLSIGIASYFSVGAVKSFVTELINVRGEFQKTEIAFTTMLGNAGQAKSLMGDMVDLASKTPFSLQDVSSGAKQLLAFQIPANEVVDTLTRMGNIAAGLGVPLSRINLVYGQVRAKGKLMGDDLRQFTEAGIPMVAELAKKFNKTTAEITGMVSAGKIGFNDVKDVLFSMTNEGGMFFNLMEKQSKSLSGQVANLGDAWDQMLNKIGESQDSVLSGGIQGLIYLVEHYQDVGKAILTLIEIYGAYRTALIVTNLLQAQITAPAIIQGFANLIKLIRGATVAQEALNAASIANPYVLVATLIAGLIAVTYNYRQELGELLGIIEAQTSAQKVQEQVMQKYNDSFGKGVVETRAAIQQLIYIIKSEYSSLQQREEAYKKLIAIDSTFRDTLDSQFRATNRLSFAFENLIKNLQKYAMAQAEVAVRAEAFKKFAEAEMNLGITQVKLDDAKVEIEKLSKLYKAGKISQEQYFAGLRKTGATEINKSLIEQKEALKDITKEKELIQKLDQKEISNLLKGNEILKAQIQGGKVQGKVLTPEGKRALQSQLSNNENILKLRFGVEPEIKVDPVAVKGWAEQIQEQIDLLQEKQKKAPNQKLYLQYDAQIKALEEKLNPKKAKTDNKQIAEILPLESIKELQRRASLIQEAYDSAVNDQVKLRKLDKYGNDKDKKGNPFYTGEVISAEEAGKRLEQINDQIKAKQYKSFQERTDEAERQWNNYYKIAEFYGKESADAQYKELFKGSANYLQYLEKEQQKLKDLSEQGILSDQQKQDLSFIGEKINSLNGTVTPLEGFKREIDDTLKSLPSLVDQLEALNNFEDTSYKKAGGNTSYFLQQRKLIEENRQNILQQQKDLQNEFLKDHETFETKRVEIEKKYNSIREQIGKNKTYSDTERVRLLDAAGKDEAKAYRDAFTSVFEKSDLFEKAFSNINSLTKKEIEKIIPQLEEKLQELKNMGAPTDEIDQFRKKIEDLRNLTSAGSPIKALINSFKELRKKIREGTATQEDFARLNENLQRTKFYTDLAVNSAKELAEAMGIDGKGGAFEKFGKDLTQTMEGLVNALVGYFSGNFQQMIGGIAQMVVGVIKMLSTAGDGRKEKGIREWKRAVDDLKFAYEELQMIIEKTAGEGQLSMQRELIANLKEQQRILYDMRSKEASKKKVDQEKIAAYTQQINDINLSIQTLIDDFKTSITTIEFKDFSSKIADALIDAFGKGEDAAASFEKVVDDVMRNAVANALRIKILEPAVKKMVDSLYSSMGFGGQSGATSEQAALLKTYQDQIAEIEKKLPTANSLVAVNLNSTKNYLLEKIKLLQQQIAANAVSGSFDGLTKEERDAIKALGVDAMNQYTTALQQYEDLFGAASANAQSLKGDIKGITEKTAGALESQFNALRINVVAMFQLMKQNHTVQNAHTVLLSQIEVNTRRLHNMDKTLTEMNAKMKKSLAGVP